MDRTELKGKRVLVFGSGISGIGAVRLLEAVQADVILYDGNEKLDKEEIKKRLPEHSLCDIVLGDMPQDLPSTLDLAVMSPGVPLDIPPVEALKRAGIPVWGEVELAYRMGAGTVLAITGTNGKTTTTALLGEIMRAYAKSVFVVGNIGNAYTGAALSMTEDGKFTFVNNPLMGHRVHEESTTTEIINDRIRTKEDLVMFQKFWPKFISNLINKFYVKAENSNS